jgi:AcrR family transcriptional regulator
MTGRKPKLTHAQVERAKAFASAGIKLEAIAQVAGVSKSTLRRHLAGKCRHHQERAA